MDVAVGTRAGRPAWVNRRTVLGAALLLLSILGGRAIIEGSRATAPVWVAARDLAGGTTIGPGTLRIEHVHLPAALAASYVPSTQSLDGYVVTRPMAAGELVPQGWVAANAPDEGRSMTVPVDPEHSVGGELKPGDLVDIYATFEAGEAGARTVVLVRQVEVVDLVASGGLVMGDEAVVGITVSVAPDESQRIAFAARTAQLDVARVDDPSQSGTRSVISRSDF